jgi:DNA polymerase/3'-5' exonuclease PolX
MANEEIAGILYEIADLLDLEGVRFKPEAYRRAARTLEQFPQEVRTLKDPQPLRTLPGIGEALFSKLEEYRRTGTVVYRDRLREKWPPGLLEIMRLEGVGPKTTRRFHQELGISDLAGLKEALTAGKLDHLAGFKARKLELLRQALDHAGGPSTGAGRRLPLPEAQRRADELMAALRATRVPLDRLVYAGSLRRRREDVGDLDLLATTRGDPRKVMEAFLHLPTVRQVRLSGETKTTVVLDGGLQVDLRVVAPEAFGAAWQYFTGSKDHNIRLRTLAQQKGWKVNEYGLYRGEERTDAPTEEDVYAAVGLPLIPPELREDQGEFEAALEGRLPRVVRPEDLQGELHIHAPASLGKEDLGPWVREARARKLRYLGFVLRPADLSASSVRLAEVRRRLPLRLGGVGILVVLETSLRDPAAPSDEDRAGADLWFARPGGPGAGPPSPSAPADGDGRPAVLVHPEDGPSPREGARPIAPLELAVGPQEVHLPPGARTLAEGGVRFLLSARPRIPEELRRLDLVAGLAARHWVQAGQVLNAQGDPLGGGPP